ncbi:MAG: hypothetical protein AAFX06_21865 [Planctomycetota bacterium]
MRRKLAFICFTMLWVLSAPLQAGDTVFEDFEENTYRGWEVTGDCFGDRPAAGTLRRQQLVSGFQGKQLVNTFRAGDQATGAALSPVFEIKKPYIGF